VVCLGALVALVAVSVGLAAPRGAGSTRTAKDLTPLTVVLGQYSSRYADLFVARYEGFFKKVGLDVNLQNDGTQALTVLLSGRADVGLFGTPNVMTLRNRGQDIKTIYTTTYGDDSGYVVGASSSYHTSADLGKAGATVALIAIGGQQLGVTQALSGYLVSHGGKALNIISGTSTTGDMNPQVAAGTVDATITTPTQAAPYIQAGKERWVTDLGPNSSIMNSINPNFIPGISVIGFDATLTAKRDAVTRFIAGLRMAERWLSTHSIKTITAVLHNGIEGFNLVDPSLIQYGLQYDKVIWAAKQEGYISNANWTKALPVWTSWKLGWDGSSSFASYANAVDMSYWNAATPMVNKLGPPKQK
jgi:ABC-type nitrate/sulfonate/bicarbonate transport system substrate-binding protein